MKVLKTVILFIISTNTVGCHIQSTRITEPISIAPIPPLENLLVESAILTKVVKQLGCKIKKNDGILYDPEFIQWKKDEFRMVANTVITASDGWRIWFEEEVYASVEDAENRLANFKKLPPNIEQQLKDMHYKIHTELDFREAFRVDKRVYFVSVPSYGQWLNGDVAKYRKKLQKIIK